jgi:arylsulfatase A-like enzyme
MAPETGKWTKPVVRRRVSFLGREEVRDLSLVPPRQLANNPVVTAGQIEAIEQRAGSRIAWDVTPGPDAYFSFVPVGTANGCDCTYRMGVREKVGKVKELFRGVVRPAAPIAPAAVEVDLTEYSGHKVQLLLQVDGPGVLPEGSPDERAPTALWGSPGLYGRKMAPLPKEAPATGKPNVLLIGVDTLRADRLGAWGRSPSLTPSLDRLAEESDVWLQAYSAFNVTNPSFASILTGLWGKNHGVYDLRTPLPADHTTLAELLAAAGYDTLALIAAHHLGDHNSGLGQGFAEVHLAEEHEAAEMPVDWAMDWLASREATAAPYFVWLHLYDPHTPHTPPEPFASGLLPGEARGLSPVRTWVPFREPGPRPFADPVLAAHSDLYDGEVAYLDRQVGRLLDFLGSRGLLANTVVALVADHGESLGEHGVRFRHAGLHDTTTHVPLMIRWPGKKPQGRRFTGLVQTIDLFPTLLKAAGIAPPPQDGVDLHELNEKNGRRAVFAEHASKLGLMVRTRTHKYILSQGNTLFFPDGAYLYDLAADPKEETNLAGRNLPVEREMAETLRRWLAARRPASGTTSRVLSPEEEARLRALGY